MADTNVTSGTQQRIIIMRHGERLDHVRPVLWHKEVDGGKYRSYDPPLTDKGVRECFTIANDLLKDKDITMVTSSPFLRCLQTAQEACRSLELPGITITNNMCEILTSSFGVDRPPIVPTPDLPQNIQIIQMDKEPLPSYPEQYMKAMKRYVLAIERIADQYYPNNILMVTHAYGVQEAFRLVQCNSDPYHFPDYCAHVELTRDTRDSQWTLGATFRVDD